MKQHSLILTTALLVCSLSFTSQAHQQSHNHGEAKLEVIIDKPDVTVNLYATAKDIVGFEVLPETEQQQRDVKKAQIRLKKLRSVLTFDHTCHLKSSAVSSLLFANRSIKHSHDGLSEHSHADAVEEDLDEGNLPEHINVFAHYRLQCDKTPRGLEAKLFDYFPEVKVLNIQLISPRRLFKRTLDENNSQIKW